MKSVLITGARGFVGSALVQYFLDNTDHTIFYTKRPPKEGDRLLRMDLKNRVFEWNDEKMDFILHAAGNPSSLDCIQNPESAVQDNIIETLKMLDIGRKNNIEHFIYVSSVEVYGQDGVCTEDTLCESRNMYAATKNASEQLCKAYFHSYGVPCSIVRLNNTFGKMCQPERFPVLAVKKLLQGEKITLHNVGRRWMSVHDFADMVFFILHQKPGQVYNTTGDYITNLQLLGYIADSLGISSFEYDVVSENIPGRIGHQDAPPDFIRSLGWIPKMTFKERIDEFVSGLKI